MINEYELNKNKWFLINQASQEEVRNFLSKLNIDPYIEREIATETPKSRIEFYKDSIYLILHFPALKHTNINKKQEIDFIIRKNDLITLQYENIDAMHTLSKTMEVKEILSKDKTKFKEHLFATVMKAMYNSVNEEMIFIESVIENITENIFEKRRNAKQTETVFEIGKMIKEILFFEKTMENQEHILHFLRDASEHIIDKDFKIDVESVILEYEKIRKSIKHNLLILQELRKTNDSLLEAKQSEAIKQLTVVGAIMLPISFIAVTFAMRTEGMPLINHPHAFWIVIGIMVACVIATLAVAKNRRWI
jgi:Mg2+ and Co2+ transporter CorA